MFVFLEVKLNISFIFAKYFSFQMHRDCQHMIDWLKINSRCSSDILGVWSGEDLIIMSLRCDLRDVTSPPTLDIRMYITWRRTKVRSHLLGSSITWNMALDWKMINSTLTLKCGSSEGEGLFIGKIGDYIMEANSSQMWSEALWTILQRHTSNKLYIFAFIQRHKGNYMRQSRVMRCNRKSMCVCSRAS